MRVLIFHGYLLRGTGSNVFNASLAPALAGLGHDVHLLCQDHEAGWLEPPAGSSGSITIHNPDIDGPLPVYVHDHYEGFEVKTFAELTDAELDRYLAANVAAVREVVEAVGGVDAALANHLVMGPVILARAGLDGYAVKVHGSALEFTVRRDPVRFLPYAREGLAGANGVLVGSRHTADVLWETMEEAGLPARTRLGPPGVDVGLFAPRETDEAVAAVRELASDLTERVPDEASKYGTELGGPPDESGFGRDSVAASVALHAWTATEPRVVFVGKLIRTKGVDLLLAAWPLVVARHPGARLLIVGFGEARGQTERLWAALERGDIDAALKIATADGEQGRLHHLEHFLASAQEEYRAASKRAVGTVHFAGRLEHDEVARVVPAADAMVVPSTFPEAFGMVAAEAAAAGVLPVCADHSGLHEVAATLAANVPEWAAPLLAFDIGRIAPAQMATSLDAWLSAPASDRAAVRAALRHTVAEHWSWEGVARSVIAASAGELERIPVVPPASNP